MRKILSFTLLTFLGTQEGFACELKMNRKLVIGCTYKCDFIYRLRLSLSALSMGYPIKIVDLRTMGNMEEALAQVDGVLMPGGADIDPALYQDKLSTEMKSYIQQNKALVKITDESKERDPYEIELLRKYTSIERFQKLPFLGICRGMQMMTVAQGIPLYLDLKSEVGIDNRRYVFDQVSVKDSSLMSEIYGNKQFKAMKLHHQGLRVPYYRQYRDQFPLVKVSAFSHNDQIAESIEYTHRPALGVQYHPEMSFTGTSAPVFKWFLAKSCEYKNAQRGI